MRRLFYSLLYAAERAQERANQIYAFTHEREKHRTEPFNAFMRALCLCANVPLSFFASFSPSPICILCCSAKKFFKKIFPQKHAKYAEQNAEQIELNMLITLVYQGKTDI